MLEISIQPASRQASKKKFIHAPDPTIMFKKSYSKTKPVCKVTFSLPLQAATDAKDVRVLGEFNSWSWENGYQMKAGKNEFSTTVELSTGKAYEFRYLIDNHIWENDWAADGYITSPFNGITNSVVAVEEVAKKTKTPAKKANGKPAPVAKTQPKAAPVVKKAPVQKAVTKNVVANKLTKIEGIGPKIEELLKDGGIVTFADLAIAKPTALKNILEAAGKRYQMHDPSTWAEQAKLAAKNDWTTLEKLQVELKGGKRGK